MNGSARSRTRVVTNDNEACYRNRTTYFNTYADPTDGYSYTQGSKTTTGLIGASLLFQQEQMQDVVIPRFKTRSARGEIFNNPCTKVHRTEEISKGYGRYATLKRVVFPPGVGDGRFYPDQVAGEVIEGCDTVLYQLGKTTLDQVLTLNPPEIDTSDLVDVAVTKAHANVSLDEINLLATAGETHETVKFLASTMRKTIRIFRAVRKLELSYLRKQITRENLQDAYLAYRYAIRPMVYDARSAVNALKSDIQEGSRMTFRGFESDSQVLKPPPYWDGNSYWNKQIQKSASTFVDVRAGVLASIDSLHQLSVWGLDRPIEAAWELVPFSFIADWFFNIGDTISSFTPNLGISELASWVAVKTTQVSRVEILDIVPGTYWNPAIYNYELSAAFSGLYAQRKVVTYTRTPNPTKSFVPTFNVNLNALKLLDLAIIGKRLTSPKRERKIRVA